MEMDEKTTELYWLYHELRAQVQSLRYGQQMVADAEASRHKGQVVQAKAINAIKPLQAKLEELKIHDLGHLRMLLKPQLDNSEV
jgi:hypothetical protein